MSAQLGAEVTALLRQMHSGAGCAIRGEWVDVQARIETACEGDDPHPPTMRAIADAVAAGCTYTLNTIAVELGGHCGHCGEHADPLPLDAEARCGGKDCEPSPEDVFELMEAHEHDHRPGALGL